MIKWVIHKPPQKPNKTSKPSKPRRRNAKEPKTPTLSCIEVAGGFYCNICKDILNTKASFEKHYEKHETDCVVYTCVSCFKSVTNYVSFRNHCYTHHVLKAQLNCEICDREFSKVSALNDHLKNIHGTHKCPPPCNKIFETFEKLKIHSATHRIQSAPKNCQTCNVDIGDQDYCEQHIDDHLEYTYSCPICDETIADKQSASQHINKHFHEETDICEKGDYRSDDESPLQHVPGTPIRVSCAHCKKSYKTKDSYEAHHNEEHGSNVKMQYTCGTCWKTFDNYTTFSTHSYNHLTKGRFKCSHCDKSFSRLAQLVVHTEGVHAGAFPCTHCPLTFAAGRALRAHLLASHGVSYQICPHPSCGKIINNPEAFVIHQIEHKNESEVMRCCKCGMPFKKLVCCVKHIELHKKKKYTCPVCSKKYCEKYLLIKHIRQHYQTVFHTCERCGKIFTKRHRLVDHMKSHSTNLLCPHCPKNFSSPNTLKQHIRHHTQTIPYRCPVCHRTFMAASNVRKHMKNVHKITTAIKAEDITIDEADQPQDSPDADNTNNNNKENTDFKMSSSDHNVTDANKQIADREEIMNQNFVFENNITEMEFDHDGVATEMQDNTNYLNMGTTFAVDNVDLAMDNVDLAVDNVDLAESQATALPYEYGVDFTNNPTLDTYEYGTQIIHLDEFSSLPHIDPCLILKENSPAITITDKDFTCLTNVTCENLSANYPTNVDDINFCQNTESLHIGKDCQIYYPLITDYSEYLM